MYTKIGIVVVVYHSVIESRLTYGNFMTLRCVSPEQLMERYSFSLEVIPTCTPYLGEITSNITLVSDKLAGVSATVRPIFQLTSKATK